MYFPEAALAKIIYIGNIILFNNPSGSDNNFHPVQFVLLLIKTSSFFFQDISKYCILD